MAVPYGIDPHVHCRDGNERHKGTIEHTFELADNQSIKKIIDMPNTNPPIYDSSGVKKRLKLVPRNRREDYFLNVALTANRRQIGLAVRAYDNYEEVAGLKFYAAQSTGYLGVTSEEEQQGVWTKLESLGYTGPVVVHCEKESRLDPKLWNPEKPVTHAFARPQNAETESVADMLRMIQKAKFKGTFYAAHITTPEAVDTINAMRGKMKVAIEVTPHHVMWDVSRLEQDNGALYKTNPPLRHGHTVRELQKRIVAGKVDTIGTDHAPHTIGDKLFGLRPSGFPSMYLYEDFVDEFLLSIGASVQTVDKMVFHNVRKIFKKVA